VVVESSAVCREMVCDGTRWVARLRLCVIFCILVLVGGGGGISYVPEKGSFVIVTRWEVGVLIIPV
jgi:hypothetical protein